MNGLEQLCHEITECRQCPRLVEWRELVAVEKRKSYRDDTDHRIRLIFRTGANFHLPPVESKKERYPHAFDIQLEHPVLQALHAFWRIVIQVQQAVDGRFQHGGKDAG